VFRSMFPRRIINSTIVSILLIEAQRDHYHIIVLIFMDNPVGEAEAGPTLRLPAIFTRLIQSYLLFYLWILVLLLPHDSYAYVIQMIINVIYN